MEKTLAGGLDGGTSGDALTMEAMIAVLATLFRMYNHCRQN
jgi:hypothetical protein